MKGLFYYGSLKSEKEFSIIMNFLSSTVHPSIIPVIFIYYSGNLFINLYFLIDVPDNIKTIKWRRFKVLGYNKYRTVTLYGLHCLVENKIYLSNEINVSISKKKDYILICNKGVQINITITEDTLSEELDLIIKMIRGKIGFCPVSVDEEHILIL